MSKGGSSSSESTSSTSTKTTTENYDQRVGAEGGGVALGSGASLKIEQQFGPEVANAFRQLIDFAKDAGAAVIESQNQALEAAQKSQDKALAAVRESQDQTLTAVKDSQALALANAEKTLNLVSSHSSKALETVSARLENQEQPQKNFFNSIFPYLVAVGVVIMVVVALTKLTKKK